MSKNQQFGNNCTKEEIDANFEAASEQRSFPGHLPARVSLRRLRAVGVFVPHHGHPARGGPHEVHETSEEVPGAPSRHDAGTVEEEVEVA
ncbi:MAG: hypothetical protein AAB930_04545 [Patescibacteria group bacterium]